MGNSNGIEIQLRTVAARTADTETRALMIAAANELMRLEATIAAIQVSIARVGQEMQDMVREVAAPCRR